MRLKYRSPQDSFDVKIPPSLERCTVKHKMPRAAFSQERDNGH